MIIEESSCSLLVVGICITLCRRYELSSVGIVGGEGGDDAPEVCVDCKCTLEGVAWAAKGLRLSISPSSLGQ